jgi:hypothetical protein
VKKFLIIYLVAVFTFGILCNVQKTRIPEVPVAPPVLPLVQPKPLPPPPKPPLPLPQPKPKPLPPVIPPKVEPEYKPLPIDGTRRSPLERRDASVYRYLTNSYRIENSQGNASIFGSGTLCWYDSKTNTGYIISCGHLFNGGEKQVGIDVYYKNKVKLARPQRFIADVICYSKKEDISFLKFKPDWIPEEYFPIAPISMSPTSGSFISAGCDNAREVAAYDVTVVGLDGDNLITRNNSPRHGRSGGGLITPDGKYVGICWGSSDPYNGTGTGIFVPLFRIHRYAKSQSLGFLLP